jgi:hypothetical protein
MTIDVYAAPSKATHWVAMPGQAIGFLVVWLALSIAFKETFGADFDWDLPAAMIGWGVGGTIGGLVQLRRQSRLWEIRNLLRQQLSVLVVCLPMFAIGWTAANFYDRPGWWIGLLGSGAFTILFLMADWTPVEPATTPSRSTWTTISTPPHGSALCLCTGADVQNAAALRARPVIIGVEFTPGRLERSLVHLGPSE